MPPKSVIFTLGLTAVLTAGCGGSGSASAPAPTATTAEAAEAAGNACADAQPEIQAGAQATGFVDSVEVASCDGATVKTTLANSADDVQSALGICSIAANEAAQHGVASVTIVAADGTELVKGTNTGDCTPA